MEREPIEPSAVFLHKARPDEIDLAFQLANDVNVRTNSFTPTKIAYTTHIAWYNKNINDPHSLILHTVINNQFAGQVKFSLSNTEALIGVSIMPDFRGRGLGTILLQKGISFLQREYPDIHRIIALIKKENTASIKLFEKVGFIFVHEIIENGFPTFKYIFNIT